MTTLTERLEVRLERDQLRQLKKQARQQGVSVAQLVRQAIELLLQEDRETRMRAVERLCQIGAPIADWDQMEREIEDARSTA